MPKLDLASWIMPGPTPDMAGKVVVLDFWATWCPPCRAAVPHNNDIDRRYREKGVVFVGVCTRDPDGQALAGFVHEFGVEYPVARDNGAATADAFAVTALPSYAVIDKSGRIRAIGLRREFLSRVIERLLAEPR
jgi:thiol-disulfide isomerase/thioredoxin